MYSIKVNVVDTCCFISSILLYNDLYSKAKREMFQMSQAPPKHTELNKSIKSWNHTNILVLADLADLADLALCNFSKHPAHFTLKSAFIKIGITKSKSTFCFSDRIHGRTIKEKNSFLGSGIWMHRLNSFVWYWDFTENCGTRRICV